MLARAGSPTSAAVAAMRTTSVIARSRSVRRNCRNYRARSGRRDGKRFARRRSVAALSMGDPFLHEAGVALALARHLDPAGEQPRRRQQQAIPQMGRIVRIFLEARDRDLLVVRVVLETAGGERHRLLEGPAVGARFQMAAASAVVFGTSSAMIAASSS